MAKVLLVEDDNNLREIYQARLLAEGYDIVTAQNGEEALVVAKQNKPDLIISDVMMPRISGFEMLDILRNTAELKGTKVIMLTALGQDDDQKRANSLGADKYLVKSQVTLEDIVNAAKELLSEDGAATPTATPQPAIMPDPLGAVAPAAPGIPAIAHVPDANPVPVPAAPAPTPAVPEPVATTTPSQTSVATPPQPAAPASAPSVASPLAATALGTQPAAPAPVPELMATPVGSPAVPIAPPAAGATPAATDPITPTLAPEPVAVQPEPDAGPAEPAQPPATGVVDAAAQGLEAEEAALQAQIASYSQEPATPPADTPTPTATEATTNNDQAIASAVKELDAPSEPTPAQPPSATAPAPTSEPATPPANATSNANDAVSVAGKKIIQPINDPSTKPDLDALLAKEEAKNPAPTAPVVSADPNQPATPVAPAAAPTGKSFDPNTSL